MVQLSKLWFAVYEHAYAIDYIHSGESKLR